MAVPHERQVQRCEPQQVEGRDVLDAEGDSESRSAEDPAQKRPLRSAGSAQDAVSAADDERTEDQLAVGGESTVDRESQASTGQPKPSNISDQVPDSTEVEAPDQPPIYPWELGDVADPNTLFQFSGRTKVWREGLRLFKESPLLGYGFHADRLILKTQMHNAYLHALVQTGLIGTIVFVAALLLGWFQVLKAVRNLNRLPMMHRNMVILMAGLMAFLSVRTLPESTGAFFGVDWLLLAPLLLYFQIVNHELSKPKDSP